MYLNCICNYCYIFNKKKKFNKNSEKTEINNKDLYINSMYSASNNVANNEYLEPVPINLNYDEIPEYAEII